MFISVLPLRLRRSFQVSYGAGYLRRRTRFSPPPHRIFSSAALPYSFLGLKASSRNYRAKPPPVSCCSGNKEDSFGRPEAVVLLAALGRVGCNVIYFLSEFTGISKIILLVHSTLRNAHSPI